MQKRAECSTRAGVISAADYAGPAGLSALPSVALTGAMITLNFSDANSRVDFSCQDSVARYLELRLQEGLDPNGDTLRHLTLHLVKRFVPFMGKDTPLRLIRAEHLRLWAQNLTSERTGGPIDPVTVRKHLVDVKTFFKRAHAEGWIDRDPSTVVALPSVEEKDPNLISARDAFHVFKVNRDTRCVGRVALEAFGGVRYTTAGKFVRADVKFDVQGLDMPSNKHKSKKRKFRQGQPANCWEWLRHAPAACWDMTLRQYRDEKKEAFVGAGMRPWLLKTPEEKAKADALKNVWRHSFASYLLAWTKNYDPVRYLMQHARASTTEIYEGRAEQFEAFLYFGITPETVLMEWDAYVALMREKFQQLPKPNSSP